MSTVYAADSALGGIENMPHRDMFEVVLTLIAAGAGSVKHENISLHGRDLDRLIVEADRIGTVNEDEYPDGWFITIYKNGARIRE